MMSLLNVTSNVTNNYSLEAGNISNFTNVEALTQQRVFSFYYGYYYQVYHMCALIISILGLITNTLNIIVFSRKEMKNSTNLLLAALAVSDILVILIRFPKTVFYYTYSSTNDYVTIFSETFIYLVFFQYMSAFLSNWISVAIGSWRFIAVTWPLRATEFCSTRRAKIVLASITALSIVVCLPYFHFLTTEKSSYMGKPIVFITPVKFFGDRYGTFQFVFRGILSFFLSLPIFILIGVTAGLIRNMYSASRERKKLNILKTDAEEQTNKTTLMLTVMIVIFIVNNLPTVVTTLAYAIPQFSKRVSIVKHTNIFKVFFMLDNTTTFFTYFCMSQNFRRSFYRVFVCQCLLTRKATLERLRNLSTETTNTIVKY